MVYLGIFGPLPSISVCLHLFGLLWSISIKFRPLWSIWSTSVCSVHFDSYQFISIQFGLLWYIWSNPVHFSPLQSILVLYDEENLSTLVKTRDMIGEAEPDWGKRYLLLYSTIPSDEHLPYHPIEEAINIDN